MRCIWEREAYVKGIVKKLKLDCKVLGSKDGGRPVFYLYPVKFVCNLS